VGSKIVLDGLLAQQPRNTKKGATALDHPAPSAGTRTRPRSPWRLPRPTFGKSEGVNSGCARQSYDPRCTRDAPIADSQAPSAPTRRTSPSRIPQPARRAPGWYRAEADRHRRSRNHLVVIQRQRLVILESSEPRVLGRIEHDGPADPKRVGMARTFGRLRPADSEEEGQQYGRSYGAAQPQFGYNLFAATCDMIRTPDPKSDDPDLNHFSPNSIERQINGALTEWLAHNNSCL